MSSVEFHFERETRRFFVWAAVALSGRSGEPAAAWQSVEMIVDSGSNRTAISEVVARAIGAKIAELKEEPIGGVTGIASRPVLNGLHLRLLGDATTIRLDRIPVLATPAARATGRRPLSVGINILGLDVAMDLRARLHLDCAQFVGHMAWA